jgi:hypothetical protein
VGHLGDSRVVPLTGGVRVGDTVLMAEAGVDTGVGVGADAVAWTGMDAGMDAGAEWLLLNSEGAATSVVVTYQK